MIRFWGLTMSFVCQIVSAIQARQEEHPLPETELIQCIWTGLLNSVEWSARPDQHEGLAVKEVTVHIPPSVRRS